MAVYPKQKRLTRLSRRGKREKTRDERKRGRKAKRKALFLDALALGQVFIQLKTPTDVKRA